MKKQYTVRIGYAKYYVRGKDAQEAKRAAANEHRNRGYDRSSTIAEIMEDATAKKGGM